MHNLLFDPVSKVESVDSCSELSCGAPQTSTHPQTTSAAAPPPPSQFLEVETCLPSSPSNEDDSVNPVIATPEVARLESQMDAWCLDLKRNVLVRYWLLVLLQLCTMYVPDFLC